MHGINTGLLTGSYNFVDHQIAFSGGRGADVNGFIRQSHMQGIPVCIGVDCNRSDAHCFGRTEHSTGDFTSISNKNFFKHYCLFFIVCLQVAGVFLIL